MTPRPAPPLPLLLIALTLGCSTNGTPAGGATDGTTEPTATMTGDGSSSAATPSEGSGPTTTAATEPSMSDSTESDASSTTSPPGTYGCPGDTLLDVPEDPAARGPWPVGVQTVQVAGLPLPTEIWYPASVGSEAGEDAVTYDLRQWLPPSQRDVIADEDNPLQPCDCYRDLPLDLDHGPYPVVLFVHGTAAWRAQSATLMAHLASRGFVVAASDHAGLFLGDSLTIACPDDAVGMQDLQGDKDALVDALVAAEGDFGFLSGAIDTTRLAVMGHSAGGNAAAAFSADEGVQVAIPLASGQRTTGSSTTLFMGGLADGVVAYSATQDGYGESPAPKALVGMSNAGHLAFSDICEISNGAGQNILEVATDYDICGSQFAGLLFDCDPSLLPAEFSREIVAFSTAAVLEDVLRCTGLAEAQLGELQARFTQVDEVQLEF